MAQAAAAQLEVATIPRGESISQHPSLQHTHSTVFATVHSCSAGSHSDDGSSMVSCPQRESVRSASHRARRCQLCWLCCKFVKLYHRPWCAQTASRAARRPNASGGVQLRDGGDEQPTPSSASALSQEALRLQRQLYFEVRRLP